MSEERIAGLGIDDILGDHRQAVLELAARHGASNVRVFGSVARGEARPDSDVDTLVDFPPDRSIFDLVGLWLDLQELLGREVDLSTERSLKDYIRPSVLREAVPL